MKTRPIEQTDSGLILGLIFWVNRQQQDKEKHKDKDETKRKEKHVEAE